MAGRFIEPVGEQIETEARLEIPRDRFEQILGDLRRARSLADGRFQLVPRAELKNSDTYFDHGRALQDRGWSLRTRQRDTDFVLTLKRPVAPSARSAVSRDELESKAEGTFEVVLKSIAQALQGDAVIADVPSDLLLTARRDGAVQALRLLGLSPLFTVETARYVWDVLDAQGNAVAELALDDSVYTTGPSKRAATEREYRMEIELKGSADAAVVDLLARLLSSRFRLRSVTDSKFDRGLIHYQSSHLRDKLEEKVQIRNPGKHADVPTAYDEVVREVDENPEFMAAYSFNRVTTMRRTHDVYYDTSDFRLYQAGCYLRMREESGRRTFTFRRLSEERVDGVVEQQEVVAGPDHSFAEPWREIGDWLNLYLDQHGKRPGAATNPDEAEQALAAVGIVPTLEISVTRDAWTVKRAARRSAEDDSTAGDHAARLKYDRFDFRRPGSADVEHSWREFEVVGVGGYADASDGAPRIEEFSAFLPSFIEACARVVESGQVEKRTHAKYFQGVRELRLTDKIPVWETDGRLSYVMMRLPSGSVLVPEPTHRSVWPHARYASALVAMLAGLVALLTGTENGLLSGDRMQLGASLSQSLGFAAVCGGWIYFMLATKNRLSLVYQVAVIVVLLAALAVSIPWTGRTPVADVCAILGGASIFADTLRRVGSRLREGRQVERNDRSA